MKLIKKKEDWYNLYDGEIGIGSTHEELQGFKLSLKNCQSIERGYDLDELFQKELDELLFTGNLNDESDCKLYKSGMYKGARIIFELLGDKKFSEEDLRLAMHFGQFGEANNQTTTIGFIQSLQQTEWDVEILMECGEVKQCECSSNKNCLNPQPKLDVDGCLILKGI